MKWISCNWWLDKRLPPFGMLPAGGLESAGQPSERLASLAQALGSTREAPGLFARLVKYWAHSH